MKTRYGNNLERGKGKSLNNKTMTIANYDEGRLSTGGNRSSNARGKHLSPIPNSQG